MYACFTSLAIFIFNGTQNTYPVNIQITVNAYLCPFFDGGWNSPINSMEIKSIGNEAVSKCNL